LGLASDEPEMT